jgi:oligopeptide/dipeptide ABC transporter ATP-binding protein
MRAGETLLIQDSSHTQTLAQLCGLTVKYVPERSRPVFAVVDVSIDLRPCEVVGIIGESGSGKSTLAAAMLRLLPPNVQYRKGSVLFEGRDLLTMDEPDLRKIRGARISLVPQDPAVSLNPVIKVGEQISEVLRAHLAMGRKERRVRVEELLREVGFNDPERIYAAYPHQLSGGQRQRVVIAQAVACRPALVIADEPTSKLDSPLQVQILALMSDIIRRHRTALLLITHDLATLVGFADRIAVMYAGRIVEQGTTEDIFERPLHPYTQALVHLSGADLGKAETGRAKFPAIAGEPPDLTEVGARCRFEPRCPERMEICARHDPQESRHEPSQRVSCFKYDN